jgi:hypothetical protein
MNERTHASCQAHQTIHLQSTVPTLLFRLGAKEAEIEARVHEDVQEI